MTDAARVFSIPASEPFLKRLIEALLAGELVPGFPDGQDPLALARVTIFLPTRRACRATADLLRDTYPDLVLLPRLRPLGDVDEDLALFDHNEAEPDMEAVGLPPAILPLERQIILTRLVLQWAQSMQHGGEPVPTPASPADAAHLARELARLLDMLAHEGIEASALQTLPPLDLQQHWQSAFDFLQIISERWPAYLNLAQQMEPAQRRRAQMQAEAARLRQEPQRAVIAAGSTGSVPVTAEFLIAIARHPRGALVLPGLDRDLDAASWEFIDGERPLFSHPQAAMASLLQRLKLAREDVQFLESASSLRLREKLIAEVMRPAETTEKWAQAKFPPQDLRQALDGLALVEAAHESEEALAIAVLMRETLEKKQATAALVTPDRALARRVAAELKRFGVQVDDSAGTPLGGTGAGIFARLVAEVAAKNCEGVSCLSLLKHPLCTLGQDFAEAEAANSALERLVFRGAAAGQGTARLLRQIDDEMQTQAAQGVSASQREKAQQRLEKFCAALKPLENFFQTTTAQPLSVFLDAHLAALLELARSQVGDGEAALAATQDGAALLDFFAALQKAGAEDLVLHAADYPRLWAAFAAQQSVRPVTLIEPRLRIYGLLEARLVQHDRLILGGLNEGVWPASGHTDPWLSRAMLESLRLPSPERRIGLAAHDFSQALGGADVWLTRSLKSNGSPAVPSRFVQRLAAVAGEGAFGELRRRGDGALRLARFLLEPAQSRKPQPISRPVPRPPIDARPRKLSVTQVERLVRDPYSIYAEEILRLRAFEPVGAVFDARQRGILIHAILSEFAKRLNDGAAAEAELLETIASHHFAPYFESSEVKNYTWLRFRALIPQLAAFEKQRRAKAQEIKVEAKARLGFDLPGGAFTLTARADRIERKDNAFAIVDFKTGQMPAPKSIKTSFALQLPLQAAMLELGAFPKLQGLSDELIYAGLSSPHELKEQIIKDDDIMAFARASLEQAKALLAKFDAGVPYRSCADSPYVNAAGDYLHLARVREWGLAGLAEADT